MNIPMGSPLWHAAILFFFAVLLLYEAWRGWRAGVVRAGLNFAAFVVAGIVAVTAGRVAAVPFGGLDSPPGWIAALGVGGLLGIGLFAICWLAGVLFFKRTSHQPGTLFRMLWGAGGACFGILLGLFLIWGGITIIRGLGALAEGKAEAARQHEQAVPSVARQLVTLRESLELGHSGEFFQSVDVLPKETYEWIARISRVTSDEKAMLRFLEYPGIRELMENPALTALLSDPQVVSAAEKRNFLALMTHPALIKALGDPALAGQLKKINLREALEYATAEPTPKTP